MKTDINELRWSVAGELASNESKLYSILIDYDYFTEEELNLITSMYGMNTETLSLACECRYALDAQQVLFEIMVELDGII